MSDFRTYIIINFIIRMNMYNEFTATIIMVRAVIMGFQWRCYVQFTFAALSYRVLVTNDVG